MADIDGAIKLIASRNGSESGMEPWQALFNDLYHRFRQQCDELETTQQLLKEAEDRLKKISEILDRVGCGDDRLDETDPCLVCQIEEVLYE